MKAIVVLLAVLTAQTFANEILECFAPVLDNISEDAREDLREWTDDLYATAERLQTQRQRCNDIHRDDPPTTIQDRLVQACNAAFSATLAFELNRLHGDLVSIDPELAAELRGQTAECFSLVAIGSRAYFAKIMNNIL